MRQERATWFGKKEDILLMRRRRRRRYKCVLLLLFDITQRIENIGSFTSIIFITLDIVLVLGEISSR